MAKQQRTERAGQQAVRNQQRQPNSQTTRSQQMQRSPQGARSQQMQRSSQEARSQQGQRNSQGARSQQVQRSSQGARSQQGQRSSQGARSQQMQRSSQGARSQQGQRNSQGARSQQMQRSSQRERSQQMSGRPQVQRGPQMSGRPHVQGDTQRHRNQPPQYARQQMQQAQTANKKGKFKRFYDYSLLFTIIFLTVFGLVMIYSSSSYSAQLKFGDAGYFMKRQGMIAVGGFVIMLMISKIDYHFFARFAMIAYAMSYVLMLMVMFSPLGVEVNGKKRWLKVVGSLQFQPTELVKIALILMIAVMITEMGSQINKFKSLLVIAAVTLPIAGLVAANNLSSGIIIVGIAFVMCFVACKLQWPFAACAAAAGGVIAFAGPIATVLEKVGIMHSYQLSRIHVWLDPEAYPQDGGYQVLQGLYAIGSGGLVGKGLGESIQKLGFVPEAQNDMVFSIICEELGIFGAISVILIFLFMIYRFMLIASNAPDLFGAMIVVGVMGHIAIQVILNIAVVTNTIPNTGITLPFISYGGTSVVFLMMEMGMVLSVSNQIRLQK